EEEWLPPCPKEGETYRQRLCSTQLTGMGVRALAAASREVFSTRFCFAPRNSSPSRNRTRASAWLVTTRVGTDPASLASSTVTEPAASASSASEYSAAPLPGPYNGNTARASCRRGSPTWTSGKAGMADSLAGWGNGFRKGHGSPALLQYTPRAPGLYSPAPRVREVQSHGEPGGPVQ